MATSSDTSEQNNVKSRRPAESAFKQQRLPAWQPILTAGTVLPTFFVIGIAFIPVGIGLLYFSDEVKEHVIDYTYCTKKDEGITCADYIKQNVNITSNNKCICEMEFNLTEDFKSSVYLYYGLSNFYQNHRRYVKSRDDEQLLGRLGRPLSSDCEPFAYQNKTPIAPCGAIANSLFNDKLTLYSHVQEKDVPVLRTGIAWNSDKEIKFRNPDTSAFNGSLKAAFANYTKPANWAVPVWELDLEIPDNNGFQNEDLIVWMRTAALPTFRKLYRRVDHAQTGFRDGLGHGVYTLKIEYNYPVTEFDGTKSFVISTTSLLGGKNPFLGVAYVVVGTLCLLLGIVLLIIHVRCSKRYYPTPTDSFFLDIDTYPHSNTAAAANNSVHNLNEPKMLLESDRLSIASTKFSVTITKDDDTGQNHVSDTNTPLRISNDTNPLFNSLRWIFESDGTKKSKVSMLLPHDAVTSAQASEKPNMTSLTNASQPGNHLANTNTTHRGGGRVMSKSHAKIKSTVSILLPDDAETSAQVTERPNTASLTNASQPDNALVNNSTQTEGGRVMSMIRSTVSIFLPDVEGTSAQSILSQTVNNRPNAAGCTTQKSFLQSGNPVNNASTQTDHTSDEKQKSA